MNKVNEEIKLLYELNCLGTQKRWEQIINTLENALKRNEPMKVNEDLLQFPCPKCKEKIYYYNVNYCPECGQKLEWGD